MKSDKLISIHQKGYLQFYIYRMIVNEARNPKNKFLREINQRDTVNTLPEDIIETEGYNCEPDVLFNEVNTELDKMYFYDRELFKLYVKHGSLRKVEAVTGIKYGAIFQTITKVKKQINESINCRG